MDHIDDEFFVAGDLVERCGSLHARDDAGVRKALENARDEALAHFGTRHFRRGDAREDGGTVDDPVVDIAHAEFRRELPADRLAARAEGPCDREDAVSHGPVYPPIDAGVTR